MARKLKQPPKEEKIPPAVKTMKVGERIYILVGQVPRSTDVILKAFPRTKGGAAGSPFRITRDEIAKQNADRTIDELAYKSINTARLTRSGVRGVRQVAEF